MIIEGTRGGEPPGALVDFEALLLDKIIYSLHMYEPGDFTHQNVDDNVPPVAYPGIINGKMWNKEQLARVVQSLAEWQHDYNVHIYVDQHSFRLVLLRGGKSEGRNSPKPKEKRSLKKPFFCIRIFSLV